MRINPISSFKQTSYKQNTFKQSNAVNSPREMYQQKFPVGYLNISFKGNSDNEVDNDMGADDNNEIQGMFDEMQSSFTDDTVNLLSAAAIVAQKSGNSEVAPEHVLFANMANMINVLKKIDAGEIIPKKDKSADIDYLNKIAGADSINNKNSRNLLLNIIDDSATKMLNVINTLPKSQGEEVVFSADLIESMYSNYHSISEQLGGQKFALTPEFATSVATGMDENNIYSDMVNEIEDMAVIDSTPDEERIHIPEYDEKAKKVLKNLSLGTNMFILSFDNAEPEYLVNSIINVVKNSDSENGKLNNNNSKIINLNKRVTPEAIVSKIEKANETPDINSIIIYNQDTLIKNGMKVDEESGNMYWSPSAEFVDVMKNPPMNVKFVILQSKTSHLADMKDPLIGDIFQDFGDTTFPVLSTEQTKLAFKEQPLLMKDINKKFTPEAIEKTIEAASLLDGTFPKKAISLMKKLSIYNVEKQEITEKEVAEYMEDAKDMFNATMNDGSIQTIFDTGIKLEDMLGKDATKAEASLYVKEMQKGTLGTKGVLIYSMDDSVGSGRTFTAKAIAGEAKAPYIEVDAFDFERKDDPHAELPTDTVKKMFSMLRTQAEANPNKSAVLNIKNFEYFLAGNQMSDRYMNIMPLVKREMDYSNKKGLNILVIGQITETQFVDSDLAKTYKFNDSIPVDTPRGEKARSEIISNEIKKLGMTLAGDKETQKQFYEFASAITDYHTYSGISSIMKKARSVAIERNNDKLTQTDFVEGYLRATTGRPVTEQDPTCRKELVTSHECGHATNLEVMRNMLKEQGRPNRESGKVNFITLDPRGWFGGAVYHSVHENPEASFEREFAAIVCSYGGYSAEKKFYDQDGSWGITADLESVTSTAQQMVGIMAQGSVKQSISAMGIPPTPEKLEKMEHDMDAITENAMIASDMITDTYSDFNNEFTKKYSPLVGTGACIVLGEKFRKELKSWIEKQPIGKRNEIAKLNDTLLEIIASAKKGIKYNVMDKFSTSQWYKNL